MIEVNRLRDNRAAGEYWYDVTETVLLIDEYTVSGLKSVPHNNLL